MSALGQAMVGVNGEALPTNRPSAMQRRSTVSNNSRNRSLSQKRPWWFFKKDRVIRHVTIHAQPEEPAIGQVQVDLFAQTSL